MIEVKIIKIKQIYKKQKIYNISRVKDNHNFFANGILVHNRS
ncbi:intein [Aquimarina sp. MAR_2010_214]|nr:intein [Aquimarina sp. MAR_2010_214]